MPENIRFEIRNRSYEIEDEDQLCGLRKKIGGQAMERLARAAGYKGLRELMFKAEMIYRRTSPLSMGEVETDRNQFVADVLIETARKIQRY